MAIVSTEKVLEDLPKLFRLDLKNGGADIFKNIERFLCFDNGYIFYANPDSLTLKYAKSDLIQAGKIFSLPVKDKNFVFSSSEGEIFNCESSFIKNLNLNSDKSYLISKISINSTVFGIIVLSKSESDFYKKYDLVILNSISSILSYVIKDLELSDVFKIQLKALKDGIVEKNEAYKVIKEQNEKILEADKVKNEFLANISHELRTPLNSILGFADILSTELYGKMNDKQHEYIDDIKASGTHLLGMINEILDMSKIEANAMKIVKSTFWITRAIDEVANILMPLAKKKGVRIIKNIDEDFQVFADYQKIQQILYNLVSNAIKYSPDDNQVEISAWAEGDTFKITVHDNGIGIDKKYHGKIFAKFVQLDSAYTKKESSTGLGLTITKELVELHDGKISIISEVNNGSTFIVEIPF